MEWPTILTILIPTLTSIGWLIIRQDRKFEKVTDILHDHGERLASIEAYIHYKESRNSTGTEK